MNPRSNVLEGTKIKKWFNVGGSEDLSIFDRRSLTGLLPRRIPLYCSLLRIIYDLIASNFVSPSPSMRTLWTVSGPSWRCTNVPRAGSR